MVGCKLARVSHVAKRLHDEVNKSTCQINSSLCSNTIRLIAINPLRSAIMSSQDKKPRSYYVDYTKTRRSGNNKRGPQAGGGGTNNARFREAPDFGQGGQRGFLITSVDEVKSYLEMRNVLEQYYHELYDTHDKKESLEKDLTTEDELESELKHLRITRPFKQIRTHCKNSIFLNIVTNFEHVDPVLIIDRFFDEMAEKQTIRTCNTFKVLPILDTFKNNVASAKEAITKLLDERFQGQEAKNYFIEFQTRGNYKLESEDKQRMIEGVAEAVAQSRPNWQVNRENVHYMIVLVALKNICCLSVVQNYFKRSKYNVIGFCKSFTEPSSEVPATIQQANSVVEVQKE